MVFHLRVCGVLANLERVMESAFTGSAEKPIAELTPEMKLGAKQLYFLFVNTVRGKALTLVRSAEKHHGMAAWKRIKSEYQPDAAERHTAMLMGIMQPGRDSRNAANFLDQLTEWERRIQEYAVLASHAPESRFVHGIWLGTTTESVEHLFANELGVYTTRTVKRVPDSEQKRRRLGEKLAGNSVGQTCRTPSGSTSQDSSPSNTCCDTSSSKGNRTSE